MESIPLLDIIEAKEYQDIYLTALNRLLPCLSADAESLNADDLRQMIASKATHLFFAHSEGQIAGTLTLVVFRIPTACRCSIEDFVVDPAFRKQGIGNALIAYAIRQAGTFGAATIDLTSHPSRTAAHGLYKHSGFKVRETMVYHYDLFQYRHEIFGL